MADFVFGTLGVFFVLEAEAGEWRYNYLDYCYEYVDALGDPKVSARYDYNSRDWEFKIPGEDKRQSWQPIYSNPFDEGEYPSALQGILRGYESALRQNEFDRACEQLELVRLIRLLDTRKEAAITPGWQTRKRKANMVSIRKSEFDWILPNEKGITWALCGESENQGDAPARNVWVYVAVYDTMDNLIEVQADMCFPLFVMPGDTAYFTVFGKCKIPETLEWVKRVNWD